MSAYRQSVDVDRAGREMVRPLLESWVRPGCPILDTNEAAQSSGWQLWIGDFILPHRDGKIYGVEVKTEQRFTGNLMYEEWSNLSWDRSRPGWAVTCRADWLVMAYLDVRAAFVIPLEPLWAWSLLFDNARRYGSKAPHVSTNGGQRNLTAGPCVPFADFWRPVGVGAYRFDGGRVVPCDVSSVRPVGYRA